MLKPNNVIARTNKEKLEVVNACTATSVATNETNEALAKPLLRPMRRISTVAGIVVAAIATTIIDIGSVAQAGFSVSCAPIMPPIVTITIEPVAEINWQQTRMMRLRFCNGYSRISL